MQSSSRFLQALARQPVDSTPVWFMRQAGRYLPEYRALRERSGGFLAMCQTPQIAAEITLQPLARFDLDAAIIFSDILTVPEAMGLGLYFKENEGPHFAQPVQTIRAIEQLGIPDPHVDLGYVMEAIRLVRHSTTVPLIGFCGSPWTVATYMVEGKSSRDFSVIKTLMYNEPEALLLLLRKVTQASCLYLEAQIEAGAQALMIFDTWGSALAHQAYHDYSLYFMNEIVRYLKARAHTRDIPLILFTKQGGAYLEAIADTGCQAIGVDWTVDMKSARARVGHRVALQGNLDVAMMYAQAHKIEAAVQTVLGEYGAGSGHIFNLGHGLTPQVPPENVQIMIDAVRRFSPAYHQASSKGAVCAKQL